MTNDDERDSAEEAHNERLLHEEQPEPVAWTSEDGVHNLRRHREEGRSHYTLGLRTDRPDDYDRVPLYAGTPAPGLPASVREEWGIVNPAGELVFGCEQPDEGELAQRPLVNRTECRWAKRTVVRSEWEVVGP